MPSHIGLVYWHLPHYLVKHLAGFWLTMSNYPFLHNRVHFLQQDNFVIISLGLCQRYRDANVGRACAQNVANMCHVTSYYQTHFPWLSYLRLNSDWSITRSLAQQIYTLEKWMNVSAGAPKICNSECAVLVRCPVRCNFWLSMHLFTLYSNNILPWIRNARSAEQDCSASSWTPFDLDISMDLDHWSVWLAVLYDCLPDV